MSNLISGKEALIALANGEEVEYTFSRESWENAKLLQACGFFEDSYQFRLKPRTITLNGIEVPAPFKPNYGEKSYRIAPIIDCGYTEIYGSDDCELQFGAWRTEEEIKQVVAALRKVFGGTA